MCFAPKGASCFNQIPGATNITVLTDLLNSACFVMKFIGLKPNQHRVRLFLAALAVSLLITAPRAQQPSAPAKETAEDRAALYQALLDLTNPWTVMCVAAHPDDEDGTSLIVMRRKYGAHTVSLFSTFGEGGQNAIGPELYEELGAIRARETMAASEIQGSEPYFLGLKDFGFSKSPEETFQKWGREGALAQMVLKIRKLRPDVIITNHSVTSNDHGHHQATARLVLEAFDAAADPKRFPEQLKNGVTTWQVQRLFVRVRGNQAPAANGQIITIDPNERDPVRGTMFAEQALAALQKHATQGPWPKTFAEFTARFRAFSGQTGATGQMPVIRYALVREAKEANAITKDAHNFLDGLRLPEDAKDWPSTLDGRPLTEFVGERDKVLGALLQLSGIEAASRALRDQPHSAFKCFGSPAVAVHDLDPRRDLMLERISAAIEAAAGIKASFVAQDGGSVVGGQNEPFALQVSNNGSKDLQLESVAFHHCTPVQRDTSGATVSKTVSPGQTIRSPMPPQGYLQASVDPEVSQAELYSGVRMPWRFQREAIGLKAVLRGVHVFLPVNSELTFLPDVEITNVSPRTAVLTSGARNAKVTFSMQVRNNRSTRFNGRLAGYLNQIGTHTSYNFAVLAAARISLNPHETRQFKMDLPQSNVTFKEKSWKETLEFPYEAEFRAQDEVPTGQPRWVDAGASAPVRVNVAATTVAPNLRVAFIRGFDYSLPDALASLSVESKELSVDEVKTDDLSKYTSIIIDNRVYESQPELIAANQKLLDYAKAGGTLIVFYHKSDEWNLDPRRNRPQLAPFKLVVGNDRVTDENAPIRFIEPDHPLLNSPNKMGQEDFVGWIQERGVNYPKEWDPQFHALLESNDPGEAPLKGGLLVADFGKGHYIYTSMVWYRQLRAGVPGAYRMLANMISYGREK